MIMILGVFVVIFDLLVEKVLLSFLVCIEFLVFGENL